jgi:hypothetical protein
MGKSRINGAGFVAGAPVSGADCACAATIEPRMSHAVASALVVLVLNFRAMFQLFVVPPCEGFDDQLIDCFAASEIIATSA